MRRERLAYKILVDCIHWHKTNETKCESSFGLGDLLKHCCEIENMFTRDMALDVYIFYSNFMALNTSEVFIDYSINLDGTICLICK